jgi:hypothetical protein
MHDPWAAFKCKFLTGQYRVHTSIPLQHLLGVLPVLQGIIYNRLRQQPDQGASISYFCYSVAGSIGFPVRYDTLFIVATNVNVPSFSI